MSLDQKHDIASHFPGASGYLNTASIGLPPRSAVEAMHAAIDEWQAGRAKAPDYDRYVAAARASFAEIVDAPPDTVAVGAQVSALVAIAATVLQPGDQVLVPTGEFTSVSFPFLVRNDLDLDVRTASLEQLADSIRPDTAMVAFSAVQSASGAVADLPAIRQAAAAYDTLTMVDATQAAGWMPIRAADYDIVVAGAYKWLLSPRGTAFMTLRAEVAARMSPLHAGWYAGESPWESIYGLPLRLATDARRFDLSPGWLAWVGTAPALAMLTEIGIESIHEHNLALANSLLAELELPESKSAIVSLAVADDFDESRLAGLSTAYRAGRLRVGFHLYNTMDDVARVVAALEG